jgi:hypothetical protein
MSILTAVALKALHLPPFSFGKWMKFALGRPLSDLIKAYTRAVSIPYSVALGLDWEALATSESRRRDRDY